MYSILHSLLILTSYLFIPKIKIIFYNLSNISLEYLFSLASNTVNSISKEVIKTINQVVITSFYSYIYFLFVYSRSLVNALITIKYSIFNFSLL